MLDYGIAVFMHVLIAVYWLGADVAVYYISQFMTDRQQPRAIRLFAARVMLHLDMFPRTCLPLTLVSGIWLAQQLGLIDLPFPNTMLALLWLAALGWIALIWAVHRDGKSPHGQFLSKIDWTIRLLLIVAIVILVALSVLGTGPIAAAWFLQVKLLIFAAIVALGLVIRVQLKPLGPLLGQVANDAASERDEQSLQSLLKQVKVVVWVIWALLWLAVWLGLNKTLAFGIG